MMFLVSFPSDLHAPGLVEGCNEENSVAWRPYNILLIVRIYLQLSELHFSVSLYTSVIPAPLHINRHA